MVCTTSFKANCSSFSWAISTSKGCIPSVSRKWKRTTGTMISSVWIESRRPLAFYTPEMHSRKQPQLANQHFPLPTPLSASWDLVTITAARALGATDCLQIISELSRKAWSCGSARLQSCAQQPSPTKYFPRFVIYIRLTALAFQTNHCKLRLCKTSGTMFLEKSWSLYYNSPWPKPVQEPSQQA